MGRRRRHGERAAAKHRGGEPGHDGRRLNVEISVHLVGPPSADETYTIAINARAKEGHGPASAGRTNRDIGEGVRRVGRENKSGADAPRQIRSKEETERKCRRGEKSVEGCVRSGERGSANGKNTESQAVDRTQVRVTGAPMTDRFVSDAVFLVRKSEGNKGAGK